MIRVVIGLPGTIGESDLVQLVENLGRKLSHEHVDNPSGDPALRVRLRVVGEGASAVLITDNVVARLQGASANESLGRRAIRMDDGEVEDGVLSLLRRSLPGTKVAEVTVGDSGGHLGGVVADLGVLVDHLDDVSLKIVAIEAMNTMNNHVMCGDEEKSQKTVFFWRFGERMERIGTTEKKIQFFSALWWLESHAQTHVHRSCCRPRSCDTRDHAKRRTRSLEKVES